MRQVLAVRAATSRSEELLDEFLERVSSLHSDTISHIESMTITLLVDANENLVITVKNDAIVGQLVHETLDLSDTEIRSVVVSLGAEPVDLFLSFQEIGIENSARLEVFRPRRAMRCRECGKHSYTGGGFCANPLCSRNTKKHKHI